MPESHTPLSLLPRDRDADAELERTILLRLEAFLSRRSPGFVLLIGLLLLALIGLVDAITGPFAVAVLYLVPVGLVTFSRGRWMGALMSGVATVAWGITEVVTHVTSLDSSITYWNGLTRYFVFQVVSLLIAPMRDAMLWERELAAKESAVAEELRTLNELRDALSHLEPAPDDVSIRVDLEHRLPTEK